MNNPTRQPLALNIAYRSYMASLTEIPTVSPTKPLESQGLTGR